MQVWRSVSGGMLGAVAALAIIVASRWLSPDDSDVLPLLGGIPLYGAHGSSLLVSGVLQLIIGAVSSLLYALVFEYIMSWADWKLGGTLGLMHAAVGGLVVAYLPLLHTDPSPRTVPGAFLSFLGWGMVLAFLAAHVVYGAIVGAWYGSLRRIVSQRSEVRWRELYPGRRQTKAIYSRSPVR